MDPLSISASILGVGTAVVKVSQTLCDIQGRYGSANTTLTSICVESNLVSATLSSLQHLFDGLTSEAFSQLQARPELVKACDCALTQCATLYVCVNEEVAALDRKDGGDLGAWQKVKLLWKESVMKEHLQSIRSIITVLNTVLQAIQL
jgi:hypothetical protein